MGKNLNGARGRGLFQQSPDILRNIIHSAMDGILVIDEDQRIVSFNPAAERLFGYSASEVAGKPLNTLIPKRFQAKHSKYVREFGKTSRTKRKPDKLGVVFGKRATGEEFPLEVSISQVTVDGHKFFTAILRDVTERIRKEDDFQQSLAKTRRGQELLLALSKVGNAVQRARTTEEICQTILDGLLELGYQGSILQLDADAPDQLIVTHVSHSLKALEPIEKIVGITTKGFHLPIRPAGLLNQILRTGETTFSIADVSLYEDILPKSLRSLAARIQQAIGIQNSIIARLTQGDQVFGLLTIGGTDLGEADLLTMTTFATQASIALNNIRLLQTVRREEERFRSLVEQLPAVTYLDEAGPNSDEFTTTFISPQVESLLGYAASDFVVNSQLWNQLIHPEDHDRVIQRYKQHYRTRQPNRDEYRMLHRDGNVIWVRDESIIVKSENGGKLTSQGVVIDISERKQAEDNLRISEQRFHNAFEHAAIGMALVGTDGRWLRVNRALCEILGYTEDELLEKTFQDISHPDDLESDLAYARQILTGKIQTFQMEKRYFHKSGQTIWALLNVSLIKDDQDKPLYFISQIENITNRKLALEGLRKSEVRYKSMFEDSPISLWEEDFSAVKQRLDQLRQAGVTNFSEHFQSHPEIVTEMVNLIKVVDVNKTTLKLFGVERKEDILENPASYLITDQVQNFQKEFTSIAEGNTRFHTESVNQTSDGRQIIVDLDWSAAPGYEESLSKVIVSLIDITDRKRATKALADERNLLRTLIDNLPDAVYAKDIQGKYMLKNAIDAKQMGAASPDETIGKTDFDYYAPELAARYQADDQVVFQTGQPIINREEPITDATGRSGWVQTTKVPLRDSQGKVIGLVGIGHDITESKLAEKRVIKQLERLAALRSIDQTITSSFDLHLSLNAILKHATSRLEVDAADVLILRSGLQSLAFGAGLGFRNQTAEKANVRLGQGCAGRVAAELSPVQIPNLATHPSDMQLRPELADEGFVSYFGVPLMAKGSLKGILEVFHRTRLDTDQEWLDFLNTLAGQAALAIDNADLFEHLQRSNMDLTLAYDATIEGWSRAMDFRDHETEGHTQRVTEMTVELAGLFGIKDEELVNIRRGALLHDIGKMGVPDSILLKPSSLTDEERAVMKRHPALAFEMLSPIQYLRSAIDIPYCHHEKWDGTGYPRGLKGEQIPLPARIFAVVDVFDALTSDRPYRRAWSYEEAIEYLKSQAGKHFDPKVVNICLQAGVFASTR